MHSVYWQKRLREHQNVKISFLSLDYFYLTFKNIFGPLGEAIAFIAPPHISDVTRKSGGGLDKYSSRALLSLTLPSLQICRKFHPRAQDEAWECCNRTF